MTLNGKNVARERRVGLNVILPLLFTDFFLSLRFRLAPSAFRFSRRRRRRRRGRRRKGKYAPRLRSSVIFQPSVWLASSLLLCLRPPPPSFFLLFATSDTDLPPFTPIVSPPFAPPPFFSLPTYTCNTVASLKKFFLLSSSSLIKLLRAFKRLSN